MKITYVIFSEEPLLQFLSFSLLDRHIFFFLLHQMVEGKREGEGGGTSCQALGMRESGWYATLVVMMNLL